jgi:hypothetical protein
MIRPPALPAGGFVPFPRGKTGFLTNNIRKFRMVRHQELL